LNSNKKKKEKDEKERKAQRKIEEEEKIFSFAVKKNSCSFETCMIVSEKDKKSK